VNFKELLDKYKNGIATEEEKKIVELEIEKYEAMEDYLSEGFNMDFRSAFKDENQNEETINVKKSVNKKLRKVVISSVATVMIILLSIFYILSPIIDNMYYNPSKISVGEHHKDLFFDLKVFTELNLPGYAQRGLVASESLGFGNHNIYFDRVNLFTQESNNVSAKIKRNMRIGSYEDFFGDNYFDYGFRAIKEPYLDKFQYYEEQKERVMSHVNQLNPVSYVSAYITFEDDLTIKEYTELSREYNHIDFKWVGVRTSSKDEVARYISGFNPNVNDGSVTGHKTNNEKYPYLQLVDWLSEKNTKNRHGMAEGYKLHYISLLRFMADRQNAVKALDHGPFKSDYYKSALKYVEVNGVNVFGVLVYADAKDFIELVENEKIKTVELDRVLASRRYVQ